MEIDLDGDLGLHGSTSPPEDEREEGEEKQEPNNKGEKVAATREPIAAIITLEKAFLFNDIDLLPGLQIVAVVLLGEARGGGVARVGRGSNRAQNRGGMKRCRGSLLAVVGVPGRTLNVVERAARRGARGRRRGKACYLRICFGMHLLSLCSVFSMLLLLFVSVNGSVCLLCVFGVWLFTTAHV